VKCPSCNSETPSIRGFFIDGEMTYKCKNCYNENKCLHTIQGCDSFVPHYDTQLGIHLESREHKQVVLKSLGLTQVSGSESPRQTEGMGRLVCSKDQYRNHKHLLGD